MRHWKAVFGVLVTILLFWWVLHDVDFGEVWAQIRQGDMLLLLAAVSVATFGFVIRAMRWKVLLTPLRPDTTLHSRFAAVSVGFMANNVLPARVGEFARAYVFSKIAPVSASGAFGTLVVERVLDGLTLLSFLLFAIWWPTFPGSDVLAEGRMGSALQVIVVVLAVLIGLMVILIVWPRPFIRAAERVAAKLPGDLARPVVDALEAFLGSLGILRSPVLLVKAVLWSVGFWLFHGVSFWLGMLAFGIDAGPDPFIAAIFTEAVVGFGVAIPSAPGFFGTFHASAEWALTGVYGVPEAQSLAFAFGYHFGGWIPITAIGLWYVWKLGLTLKEVESSEERVEAAVEAEHPVVVRMLAGAGTGRPGATRAVAEAVEITAPAKVNLLLRILSREPSGFHRIETVFQAVDLQDELRIETGGGSVTLDVAGADVGPVEENLVLRAAWAFLEETGVHPGLRIHLRKRIPAGSGLGGGSSDAAATLKALNFLFGEPLGAGGLAELGASLGSDVSFFLGGDALALGWGRGERLRGLPPLPPVPVLLVLPPLHVSTADAYGALAERRERKDIPDRPPLLQGIEALDWAGVVEVATNDFEEVVFQRHPSLAALRRSMEATEPRILLMSGSGSALFAIYGDDGAAESARARIGQDHPEVSLLVTRTLGELPRPVT